MRKTLLAVPCRPLEMCRIRELSQFPGPLIDLYDRDNNFAHSFASPTAALKRESEAGVSLSCLRKSRSIPKFLQAFRKSSANHGSTIYTFYSRGGEEAMCGARGM